MPNPSLEELIRRARGIAMSPEEREAQRVSFAYGNSKIENDQITRDSVKEQAKLLAASSNGKKN